MWNQIKTILKFVLAKGVIRRVGLGAFWPIVAAVMMKRMRRSA